MKKMAVLSICRPLDQSLYCRLLETEKAYNNNICNKTHESLKDLCIFIKVI